MEFECVSVIGYASDRSSAAMLECHDFATAFSKHFSLPYKLIGKPAHARDLHWDKALTESNSTFTNVASSLENILENKRKPILITPRCASSIASLPVIVAKVPDVMVLYLDAHGDFNTPKSSVSNSLNGMPLSAVLGAWESGYGAGLKASNLIHIGGRDFDLAEKAFIKQNNIQCITKCEIEGDLKSFRNAINNKPVYVHLDTDVYDPSEVRADYAVDDGLFRKHVKKIIDIVLDTAELIGIEITELSPTNDDERLQSYSAILESFDGMRE